MLIWQNVTTLSTSYRRLMKRARRLQKHTTAWAARMFSQWVTSSSPFHKEIVQSCRNENLSLHLWVRPAQRQNASSGWVWIERLKFLKSKRFWHIGAALRQNMASLFKLLQTGPLMDSQPGQRTSYLVLTVRYRTRVLDPFETSLCSPSEWSNEWVNEYEKSWVGSWLIWPWFSLSLLHPVKWNQSGLAVCHPCRKWGHNMTNVQMCWEKKHLLTKAGSGWMIQFWSLAPLHTFQFDAI